MPLVKVALMLGRRARAGRASKGQSPAAGNAASPRSGGALIHYG